MLQLFTISDSLVSARSQFQREFRHECATKSKSRLLAANQWNSSGTHVVLELLCDTLFHTGVSRKSYIYIYMCVYIYIYDRGGTDQIYGLTNEKYEPKSRQTYKFTWVTN